MSRRRRSIMSEQLKQELAKDLGFYDTVQKEGWGGIRAKDAGNMIKRAIQLAEQAAAQSYTAQAANQPGQAARPAMPQQTWRQTAPMPQQRPVQQPYGTQQRTTATMAHQHATGFMPYMNTQMTSQQQANTPPN